MKYGGTKFLAPYIIKVSGLIKLYGRPDQGLSSQKGKEQYKECERSTHFCRTSPILKGPPITQETQKINMKY